MLKDFLTDLVRISKNKPTAPLQSREKLSQTLLPLLKALLPASLPEKPKALGTELKNPSLSNDTSDRVALARMGVPKGFKPDDDSMTHLGQNPSWFVGNRFIKRTGESPKIEALVGDAFRATKTPGAHKVGFKEHKGSVYTISEKLDGKQIGATPSERLLPHLKHAGNIILSELLAGAADRHGGNYVVGKNGIHSIDHEYGLQAASELGPQNHLYNRYLTILGKPPVADKEHLNRWIKYAPKLIEQLKTNPPHEPTQEIDEYIEHLKGTLAKAHELAKKHGHVPLKELIPEDWHMYAHYEPRDNNEHAS